MALFLKSAESSGTCGPFDLEDPFACRSSLRPSSSWKVCGGFKCPFMSVSGTAALYGAAPYVHHSSSDLSSYLALQSDSDHHQNPRSIASPVSSPSSRVSSSSPPSVLRARDDSPGLPATPSTLL